MSKVIFPSVQDLEKSIRLTPKTVETSSGPMEYADTGQGPVLLCVHGAPGGYDQGLLFGELFKQNGFRVISVSRPGFMGTPLSTGKNGQDQARALAALLDQLQIDSAFVLGASAGGTSTYTMAALYPKRVRALMEIDSVSKQYIINASEIMQDMFITPAGLRLTQFFADHFPKTTLKSMLKDASSLDRKGLAERYQHILADPVRMEYFLSMVHTFCTHADKRAPGTQNDMDNMRHTQALPVETIACPTLIFHGTADSDVVPDHASFAHEAIKGSELYWVQGGSHMGFWLADTAHQAQERAVTWLRDQATQRVASQ